MNDKYDITGKLLLTCNPKKNWLYTTFYKPFQHHQLPGNMAFIQSLVTDNDFREKGSVEKLKGITNKAKRERLLYGNWDYEDNPYQLADQERIEEIYDNDHIQESVSYLTVDVARYGSDKAVIIAWKGWIVKEIISFDISSTQDIVLWVTGVLM